MRRPHRTPRALCVVLLLAGALDGCERATETTQAAAPVQVRAVAVRRGEISEVLTVTGETAALSVLRLTSPVAGHVTFLTARPGDHLAQGAVAARVIPLENEAALHGFAFLDNTGNLSAAERQLTRRLRAELSARDIPLRAPFPAVVAERLRNPGEQVAQNDPLLELFDPSSLYVLAQVPVDAAARIEPQLPVQVSAGGTSVPGAVTVVVTTVVPQALTVPVRIALQAPLQPLLLHAAVQCRITVAEHTEALLIPRTALISSTAAQRATIMIVAGDRARRRTIQLGLQTQSEVEVTEGITPGDSVLVDGHYALPDGTRIRLTADTRE